MRGFFYGNWFIGLCAVALGVESALQQHVPINGPWYHILVFSGCVAFYNHAYRAYLRTPGDGERARWFAEHALQQRVVQVILLSIVCGIASWQRDLLFDLDGPDIMLVAVFLIVAMAYYGSGSVALRNIGMLKPFVLGFVWAGVVTVLPVVLAGTYPGIHVIDTGLMARLFFKNMMFCAMIAVLFDIKDHAGDHRSQLRTFVVQRGLRSTLFRILLPLTLLGLVTFLVVGYMHGFSAMRIFWNALPFAALLMIIFTLRKRRSILYYLSVVDGLLLLKAACGSIGMIGF